MMGVSRSTLWRMVQNGTFPAPAHITLRSRGYLLETVEEWMMLRAHGADDARKPPNGDAGTRSSASMPRGRSVAERS